MQPQTIQADVAGGALGGHGEAVQDAGDLSQVLLANRRQCHPSGRSEEQLSTNHRLQFSQLVTDRRGRQIEQFGGASDIPEAGCLLKGLNSFQRWQYHRCIAR
ncbi:hypothetical protein D3C75_998440 [compost metagenome]